jgi:hypothetical protein
VIIRPYTMRPWQVRAALDGRLRRIVVPLKVQPPGDWRPAPGLVEIHRCDEWGEPVEPRTKRDVLGMGFTEADGSCGFVMPYAPGDSLYGRETWHPTLLGDWPFVEYKTDSGGDEYLGNSRPITIDQFDRVDSERRGWRSPVTMPKWASRWTLTVGDVAVIRVWDLTEDEAIECGIEMRTVSWASGWADYSEPEGSNIHRYYADPRQSLRTRFNADHPGAWDRNDWCVSAAVETRKGNCDE